MSERVLHDEPLPDSKKHNRCHSRQRNGSSAWNTPAPPERRPLNQNSASSSSGISPTNVLSIAAPLLVTWFLERPREKQIVVAFGAIFTAKRSEQQKWKNNRFQDAAPVRTANIQTLAIGTASQQMQSAVHSLSVASFGILTRRLFEVKFEFACFNCV
jgi:hypothetical protein